jgi:DNA adenine methylase
MISNQPLKWHGGKSYLAKWIHSLAPTGYTHRNIVFAGGLGEFWNWLPIEGVSEAVNDSYLLLTNFYDVLRSRQHFAEFSRALELVPFSDDSFKLAEYPARLHETDCISSACAFFVTYRQSRQGLGKDYATPTTRTRRGMNENVSAWLSAVDGLADCHERLRRVEIRNMDFVDFIQAYDHENALFYCDPPYLHDTRKSLDAYGQNEMSDLQHVDLLNVLCDLKGKFMLSGYPSVIYRTYEENAGWHRHEKKIDNKASSSKTKERKTECLWTNY